MKIHEAILLLLHCTMAIALTLDNLPRRMDMPSSSSHRFGSFDMDDDDFDSDDDGDYISRTAMNKRRSSDLQKLDFGSNSNSILKTKNDPETLWEMPSYPSLRNFREQVKRDVKNQRRQMSEKENNNNNNQQELADILKDDDDDDAGKKSSPAPIQQRDRKVPPDAKRKSTAAKKNKRESEKVEQQQPQDKEAKHENDAPDFQEWLRREYYRNMAKSFASMRKKRAMWDDEMKDMDHRRTAPPARASRPKKSGGGGEDARFEEVTDSLKSIEDELLADALKVIKASGEGFEQDRKIRRRITNDLNAAYDIETMRAALFRLKDNLYSSSSSSSGISEPRYYYGREQDDDDDERDDFAEFRKYKKRGPSPRSEGFNLMPSSSPSSTRDLSNEFLSTQQQCPPLAVLTSDCSALGDTVPPDDSLKELLAYACNWHEVCYSCGEIFGLNSDSCDMGFVEQSRTICRGDVPCESTAKLLLLPLRQRRVFYKRSSPNICLVDPCVEDFLTRV